jgi:hypothetical protein
MHPSLVTGSLLCVILSSVARLCLVDLLAPLVDSLVHPLHSGSQAGLAKQGSHPTKVARGLKGCHREILNASAPHK